MFYLISHKYGHNDTFSQYYYRKMTKNTTNIPKKLNKELPIAQKVIRCYMIVLHILKEEVIRFPLVYNISVASDHFRKYPWKYVRCVRKVKFARKILQTPQLMTFKGILTMFYSI